MYIYILTLTLSYDWKAYSTPHCMVITIIMYVYMLLLFFAELLALSTVDNLYLVN